MSLKSPAKQPSKNSKPDMKRRAQVVAWSVLALGLFGSLVFLLSIVLVGSASGEDLFYLAFYGLVTLLGYYLTKFNLTALRILRLLSWIYVILGGVVLIASLSTLPLALQLLSATAGGTLLSVLFIVSFFIMQLMPVVSLIILIVTNPPAFRKLFR